MKSLLSCVTILPSYSNHLFSLDLSAKTDRTVINMKLFTHFFTTRKVPNLKNRLKNELPLIFQTHCFNDGELPFEEEVTYTPIGHLFEHILLEYLCDEQMAFGKNTACYEGWTTWDWNNNSVGTYSIEINIGIEDMDVLIRALSKSVRLLTDLLISVPSVPVKSDPLHLAVKPKNRLSYPYFLKR